MTEHVIRGFANKAKSEGLDKEAAFSLFKQSNAWGSIFGRGAKGVGELSPAISQLDNAVAGAPNALGFLDKLKQYAAPVGGKLKPFAAPIGLAAVSAPLPIAYALHMNKANKALQNQSAFSGENLSKVLNEYQKNLYAGDLKTLAATGVGVGGLGLAGKGLYDSLRSEDREDEEQNREYQG